MASVSVRKARFACENVILLSEVLCPKSSNPIVGMEFANTSTIIFFGIRCNAFASNAFMLMKAKRKRDFK